MRVGVNATPWPVPIVKETGWAPEPVWTAAENVALTRVRSPDRSSPGGSTELSWPALIFSMHFNILPSMHKVFRVVLSQRKRKLIREGTGQIPSLTLPAQSRPVRQLCPVLHRPLYKPQCTVHEAASHSPH